MLLLCMARFILTSTLFPIICFCISATAFCQKPIKSKNWPEYNHLEDESDLLLCEQQTDQVQVEPRKLELVHCVVPCVEEHDDDNDGDGHNLTHNLIPVLRPILHQYIIDVVHLS